MNRIVMELLNLESSRAAHMSPTCEKLDLSAMIKGQLAAFSMMFNDNGIKLIDRIPDGLTVHSDEADYSARAPELSVKRRVEYRWQEDSSADG